MLGLSVAVPQLPDTVIVWPVTVGRLVYISSSAAAESLQFATLKVYLKPVAAILDRLGQLMKMLLRLALDMTAAVFSAGTVWRA